MLSKSISYMEKQILPSAHRDTVRFIEKVGVWNVTKKTLKVGSQIRYFGKGRVISKKTVDNLQLSLRCEANDKIIKDRIL